MPASTRILVVELETIAQFPRLPEASMDTLTPMFASILAIPVDSGVTFWLAGTCVLSTAKDLSELEAHGSCAARLPRFAAMRSREAWCGADRIHALPGRTNASQLEPRHSSAPDSTPSSSPHAQDRLRSGRGKLSESCW